MALLNTTAQSATNDAGAGLARTFDANAVPSVPVGTLAAPVVQTEPQAARIPADDPRPEGFLTNLGLAVTAPLTRPVDTAITGLTRGKAKGGKAGAVVGALIGLVFGFVLAAWDMVVGAGRAVYDLVRLKLG